MYIQQEAEHYNFGDLFRTAISLKLIHSRTGLAHSL